MGDELAYAFDPCGCPVRQRREHGIHDPCPAIWIPGPPLRGAPYPRERKTHGTRRLVPRFTFMRDREILLLLEKRVREVERLATDCILEGDIHRLQRSVSEYGKAVKKKRRALLSSRTRRRPRRLAYQDEVSAETTNSGLSWLAMSGASTSYGWPSS